MAVLEDRALLDAGYPWEMMMMMSMPYRRIALIVISERHAIQREAQEAAENEMKARQRMGA